MKFSFVLALLPLALAAPSPATDADAAAATKQPCCSDCRPNYKVCREGCWDRGIFGYCTYQCIADRTLCIDTCKECNA
ncbi:hypothetical protein MKX07_004518 [Trichoderma sp. CBMAI-0711]|nr:hypothetical protein MKX07_004518 [Trichoderma sp. CBMAI-0711]